MPRDRHRGVVAVWISVRDQLWLAAFSSLFHKQASQKSHCQSAEARSRWVDGITRRPVSRFFPSPATVAAMRRHRVGCARQVRDQGESTRLSKLTSVWFADSGLFNWSINDSINFFFFFCKERDHAQRYLISFIQSNLHTLITYINYCIIIL